MEYRSFFLPLLTIIAFAAAAAQPHSNITLSSIFTTTTAGAINLSWLSPSSDFAFGFLPLPTNSSLFLLVIWFANLPITKTLIWTPNQGKPLHPHHRSTDLPPSSHWNRSLKHRCSGKPPMLPCSILATSFLWLLIAPFSGIAFPT
ncbi:G-type lectin S-receptor-like serine/threonine-protein kinase [Dendrobium catenatum]|uniref:G-type lectin S-receptor-like serine/threonine-protein kinase n=1 Tax=Dendrobium catenatum TaxID=906689 RepID=A0A2I0W5M8_9ASPA|nr:G-type lectin S-receptor-like serine/threonine-protein kinase [Dendrobium catenatum]